jgi:uncharacterized protein (DUF362 family)
MMHGISRRKFLQISAGTGAFWSIHSLCSGCHIDSTIIQPKQQSAIVSAITGNDLEGMTCEALQTLGGIQQIVQEGESVFIKPNMVTVPWSQSGSAFRSGECAKSEIVAAVTEECLKAGASEVIIGDGSQLYTFDWHRATTLDNETNLVLEAKRLSNKYSGNVSLACLETDSPAWIEIPSESNLSKIAISSLVHDTDRIISIAAAKTHAWAQLTLSLKNFVGVTSMERYAEWMPSGYWDRGKVLDHSSPAAIGQIYLDIVKALKPDLAIIDFSIGVEGDGPTTGDDRGRTVDLKNRLGKWLILASTDLVAADATAARIMNHDPNNIEQLKMGYSMGLGVIDAASIDIQGELLRDLQVEWAPAVLKNRG